MFQGCFTYDFKGLCHIYYPKTTEQKEHYEGQINTLNEGEVEVECRLAFDKQEKVKEEKWTRQGKEFPTRRTSWEVYQKNHKQKRDKRSRGRVDNIQFTYETIKPLLIPFYHEITAQVQNPDELNPRPFVFQQDNAPSRASKWTLRRLEQEGIEVLEHVGNSLDMNAIEDAYMPMRIAITQDQGAPHTLEWTDRAQRVSGQKFHKTKFAQWRQGWQQSIN